MNAMRPQIKHLSDLLTVLRKAISEQGERLAHITAFQEFVWECKGNLPGATAAQTEVCRDLAMDLDYYQPDPSVRAGDPSLYGDERVITEIEDAVRKLGFI